MWEKMRIQKNIITKKNGIQGYKIFITKRRYTPKNLDKIQNKSN